MVTTLFKWKLNFSLTFRISKSVDFWNFLISFNATFPGANLFFGTFKRMLIYYQQNKINLLDFLEISLLFPLQVASLQRSFETSVLFLACLKWNNRLSNFSSCHAPQLKLPTFSRFTSTNNIRKCHYGHQSLKFKEIPYFAVWYRFKK